MTFWGRDDNFIRQSWKKDLTAKLLSFLLNGIKNFKNIKFPKYQKWEERKHFLKFWSIEIVITKTTVASYLYIYCRVTKIKGAIERIGKFRMSMTFEIFLVIQEIHLFGSPCMRYRQVWCNIFFRCYKKMDGTKVWLIMFLKYFLEKF